MSFNIAIDGPAGAGKSTVAKELAKRLSFIYVDTGAMYRTMALYFIRQGIDLKDEKLIGELCQDVSIEITYEDGVQQLWLNGENVTSELRAENVGQGASLVSVVFKVREKLVELQKKIAEKNDIVMDGRDIGTAVLPNADVKIYLTADVEVRAKRRCIELEEKGVNASYIMVEQEMKERDYRDMNREHSPLVQAEDAILIDCSNMTIEEEIDMILKICKEKREVKEHEKIK